MTSYEQTFFSRGPITLPAFIITAILITLFSAFANAAETETSNASVVAADLRVTILASADTVAVGENVTFTVTVCNDGPDTALSPAVSRAFPGATLLSSTSTLITECKGGQTFPPTNGLLASGFGIRFSDTLRADVVGSLSYRAFTTGFILADPNPANNDLTVQTAVTGPSAPPVVFQAAGPNAASIQTTVDQFRAALGANNGNAPGPLATGRREINWDGGGSSATSFAATPFDGFLNIRGGRFTTDGSGFLQAPAAGLGDFLGNPFYAQIFKAFSPVRLFAPVGSRFTETKFFIPGTNGGVPATTRGFGVVFTDVDRADPVRRGQCNTCTLVEYLDANGQVLFTGAAPASPGDGNLSFFGVVFDDARVASVRITTGAAIAGPNEFDFLDLVMMDDFIYAEPQAIQ